MSPVKLLRDENGQTVLEYVAVAVFVIIAVVLGLRLVKAIVSRVIMNEGVALYGKVAGPDSSSIPAAGAPGVPPMGAHPGVSGTP